MVMEIPDLHRPSLVIAVLRAREYELARNVRRIDLLEFVSHCLVEEASGVRLGRMAENDRIALGGLLNYFAEKYNNPPIVRAIAALATSSLLPSPIRLR